MAAAMSDYSLHAPKGVRLLIATVFLLILCQSSRAEPVDQAVVHEVVQRGLEWIAQGQSRLGHWEANEGRYPTAMTALAGLALLSEGSTTTQGKYAKNIRMAVDYLTSRSNPNGLIGDPRRDDSSVGVCSAGSGGVADGRLLHRVEKSERSRRPSCGA